MKNDNKNHWSLYLLQLIIYVGLTAMGFGFGCSFACDDQVGIIRKDIEDIRNECAQLSIEKNNLEWEIEQLEETKFILWEEKEGMENTIKWMKLDYAMVEYYVTLEVNHNGENSNQASMNVNMKVSKELFDNINFNENLTNISELFGSDLQNNDEWEIYCIDKYTKER